MARYAVSADKDSKSCKARGDNLRVHYKNTHATVNAIRGMRLSRAITYMQNVIQKKEIVPFRVHKYGIGRHAQLKAFKANQGCWPKKSAQFVLGLLRNAESNAEVKGLDASKLVLQHALVNRAPKLRRRTYRAHGRINAYQSSPSSIELMAVESEDAVPRPQEVADRPKKKVSQKKLARERRAPRRD